MKSFRRIITPGFIAIALVGIIAGWGTSTLYYQHQLDIALADRTVYGVGGGPDISTSDSQNIETIIRTWDIKPQQIARAMIDRYGLPQEITPYQLTWHANGPWIQTVVHKTAAVHNFPIIHSDYLEQTIYYRVPTGKVTDLVSFDGSLTVNRTQGELSHSSDSEAMNFLALNLANDIVTNKKTVDQARKEFADEISSLSQGTQPDYMLGLRFASSASESEDPDISGM